MQRTPSRHTGTSPVAPAAPIAPIAPIGLIGLVAVIGLIGAVAGCRSPRLATFETPEAAVAALGDLAGSGDDDRATAIFGAEAVESIRSGDPVADREDGHRVKRMIAEKVSFESAGDGSRIALLGNDEWPFPFPLVETADGWRFDAGAGLEELLNRRVGRNEILTISALRAYVAAQREYESAARDGSPPSYARRFASREGLHDGLWWPTREGEPESPLGPLIAEAEAEGYELLEGSPAPYHGYFYRILTGERHGADRGERSYLDADGRMTLGFAAIAWPAKYGSSGVMTFQVNRLGMVFEKDLGPDTEEAAAAITLYDADATWAPVED